MRAYSDFLVLSRTFPNCLYQFQTFSNFPELHTATLFEDLIVQPAEKLETTSITNWTVLVQGCLARHVPMYYSTQGPPVGHLSTDSIFFEIV